MKILKKPLDHVAKQLQSKRFHVKKQENKKVYDRMKFRKEARKSLDDSSGLSCWGQILIFYILEMFYKAIGFADRGSLTLS